MEKLVVRLYSRSPSIVSAVRKVCEEHGFGLEVNAGPRPVSASFVVTTAAHSRDSVVLANTYCTPLIRCESLTLPEAGLYLAAGVRYARGLTVCGSDHISKPPPEPKQPEGVLF